MAEQEQPDAPELTILHTRGYQQEMLEESLRMNLIIALDTGSGKTHIAVLRMKLEAERETKKVSWFLAPTVALVEQQWEVIKNAIPVSVSKISGASEPNQWKDAALWRRLLESHRIIVSTPQILLDALHHGYIDLGRDVSLLVFDEAHHAIAKHPYNMIMQEFYMLCPPSSTATEGAEGGRARPKILGLTASPIYGGNVDASFRALERNLDSTIRSSRVNREELAKHVHRPIFKHVLYSAPDYTWDSIRSINYEALNQVVQSMDIEKDPYVRSLRAQLTKPLSAEERRRVDQKLSKTLTKQDTFCHKGLRDFARTAQEITMDLGSWAADWYVVKVMEQARHAANPYNNIMSSWQDNEKRYLLNCLSQINATPPSYLPDNIQAGISDKVRALVDRLVAEEAYFRSEDETYSGLVFVTRRDTVIALSEVLQRLPQTAQLFRTGCLLGSSSSMMRHSFLDITRDLVRDTQLDTLAEFRSGEKNLIISTAVAEEGIDIQACGSVIRFDPPPNVVAWAQSRGRARRKKSSFILMFETGGVHQKLIRQWEETEAQMMALYNDTRRAASAPAEPDDDEDNGKLRYTVPSTGAVLTLNSATSHLNHFCAVLPNSSYSGQAALYDLDPPDYPDEFHAHPDRLKGIPDYRGPWGATVTLPRALPKHLRVFSTPREHDTKRSAQRHAAFKAYTELHKAGLLNDHLLPLTSAIEPDQGEEVKMLLAEIEKRAGTEQVSIQIDPWTPRSDETSWWKAQLVIEGLPPLHMFTRNPLPCLAEEEAPTLHIPRRGLIKVHLQPLGKFDGPGGDIERARQYTARLFTVLYSAHMKLDDTEFSYLFLPESKGKDENLWEERRLWMKKRIDRAHRLPLENLSRANADVLAKQFAHPTDLALIRPNHKFGKPFRFVKWYKGPLSKEEKEELLEAYEGFADVEIAYPLMQVQALGQRANFLVPLPFETQGLGQEAPTFLLPRHATVELISVADLEYSILLPSVLRSLTNTFTATSLRQELLAPTPTTQVPLTLITTAITAPVSQELTNYQRLETLGDTVLKYITSIQLFADHPLWHEGYLARRKDHAVSNVQLAKAAISKGLHRWIIRDRFVPRKWRPHYLSQPEALEKDEKDDATTDEKKKKKQTQELSTKVLADVVESLIGAAYEHDGFDLAVDCVGIFGLGLAWKKIPSHINSILATVEPLENPPSQLSLVETMLGYQFSRKALLVQALTHASYHGDLATMSYERLEFLGDSALDMIVTDYLYHAPGKNYKPGHMHMRKEALVNAHFLGYYCLRTHTTLDANMPTWTPTRGVTLTTEQQDIYLWQCLLHSSHRVLEDQNVAFSRFQKVGPEIQKALMTGTMYPWAALTSLQAPKFVSDMLESLLGAVFIDASGSLDAVRHVLRNIGIIDFMETMVEGDMDVHHPISRLCIWADKQDPKQKVKLEVNKADGNVSCAVLIDDRQVVEVTEPYRSRASQEEVRFAAAEEALQILRVIDEDDWGDVPDYDW